MGGEEKMTRPPTHGAARVDPPVGAENIYGDEEKLTRSPAHGADRVAPYVNAENI